MRIFVILCLILIAAFLYQSYMEPFFQGYIASDYGSNVIPTCLPSIY